jgi:hypothetical protein
MCFAVKIRFLKLLGLLLIFFLAPGSRAASSNTPLCLLFADSLLASHDYYRAITEYKRSLFCLPDSAKDLRARAIMGIGKALFLGGEHSRAASWLLKNKDSLALNSSDNLWRKLLFSSLIKSKQTRSAIALSRRLHGEESVFYRSIALAQERKWREAAEELAKIQPSSGYYGLAQSDISICREASSARYRNPKLAGFIGFIPGAGYLYAGHKKSAFSALIMNAVFIYSTVEAFDSGMYVFGGFLSLLSLTWYSGSIYGSIHAAERYNRRLDENYMSRLEY